MVAGDGVEEGAAVAAGAAVDPVMLRQAQKAAGELLWLATRTRPDLSYSLQKLCAIVSTNPARAVRMAKRIIRYLRMSVDTGIFMSNRAELARALALQETSLMAHYDPDTVLAYSDASFAPIAAD